MPIILKKKSSRSQRPAPVPVSGIGRLIRWHLLGLSLLAGLTITGQVAVQSALTKPSEGAQIAAGVEGQRTLGQKLALTALAVQAAETPQVRAARAEELRRTADEWETAERRLASGHAARWAAAETPHQAMLAAARSLLASLPPDGSRQKPDLYRDITPLLQNEKPYLETMDAVVAAYEQDAKAQFQSLRQIEAGLLAVTLLALLAQGALVFGPGQVRRTIDAQREMEGHQADQEAALAEADRQIAEMQNLLANLSTMDALTGLRNHRAFQEQLEAELGRSLRHDRPLSLLLIDVDRFKSYNEAYGHPNGDRALKRIAGVLKENARTSDIPARFGGEEFAVILTETDMMGSVVLGERLRQAIAGGDGLHRPLTASIGIATLTPGMCGTAELIAQADRALCSAKGDGRNRVSHAHQLPATEDNDSRLYAHAA